MADWCWCFGLFSCSAGETDGEEITGSTRPSGMSVTDHWGSSVENQSVTVRPEAPNECYDTSDIWMGDPSGLVCNYTLYVCLTLLDKQNWKILIMVFKKNWLRADIGELIQDSRVAVRCISLLFIFFLLCIKCFFFISLLQVFVAPNLSITEVWNFKCVLSWAWNICCEKLLLFCTCGANPT